jgi:uncharacterized protein (TIGR02172 family)
MDVTLGQLIAEGRTAEVYALSEDRVIKLFYPVRPDHWVQEEIQIANIISSLPIPMPKLIDSVEINGRKGIIYERVNGTSLLKLATKKPWRVVHFARLLAELHTEIHKNEVNHLPSQRAALKRVIQRVDFLSHVQKERILGLVDALPDGNTLCHFDFHPDQVLITNDGPVVIDWVTAKQGDALSDVARTCVILKFGQASYGSWVMRVIINIWRKIFYRIYIKRYLELHPGVMKENIDSWMIPIAAGRLAEAIPEEREPILNFIQSQFYS